MKGPFIFQGERLKRPHDGYPRWLVTPPDERYSDSRHRYTFRPCLTTPAEMGRPEE